MSKLTTELPQFTNFYCLGGSSTADIEFAKQALNLDFSVEYQEYLLAFGTAIANGHELTGLCTSSRLNVVSVTQAERLRNPTIPHDWYVIEQANIDGIVIWQNSQGEVYQSAPNQTPVKLSNSLLDHLR